MTDHLQLTMDWERLDEGPDEERACFGQLQIRLGAVVLSEGQDGFVERTRPGPLVSGYPLAEWLAWNWWRLICEPRRDAPDYAWQSAHCLGTVGGGYVWPNVTIHSDRERTALVAKPTHPRGASAFRFTADQAIVVPTRQLVSAMDEFMAQMQGKLRTAGIASTNFDAIWRDVLEERARPEEAVQRELEALLGFDPDAGDAAAIRQLIDDATLLGRDAIMELSAGHRPGQPPPGAADLQDWASRYGSDSRPADRAALTGFKLDRASKPAWSQGYEAARALRHQLGLGEQPVNDQRLGELCAVSPTILDPAEHPPLAFALNSAQQQPARIVLRSNYRTGRRFELARLLGDQLASGHDEPLTLVSGAYTYRQKLQRAFAAELLCPFAALDALLEGDYSESAQEDAAQHFDVSDRVVVRQLRNHGRLETSALDDEIGDTDRREAA